jgi:hypothetical protein
VQQIVQPQGSCHLTINEAKEQYLLALGHFTTEIGQF